MPEDGLILSQSEYEHLLEEIRRLQARITELTALRELKRTGCKLM